MAPDARALESYPVSTRVYESAIDPILGGEPESER
jgi:hypothetical protein